MLCLIGMSLTVLLAFVAKLHHYPFSWFGDLQVTVHNNAATDEKYFLFQWLIISIEHLQPFSLYIL